MQIVVQSESSEKDNGSDLSSERPRHTAAQLNDDDEEEQTVNNKEEVITDNWSPIEEKEGERKAHVEGIE